MEKNIKDIIKQQKLFASVLNNFSIDIVLFDVSHIYLYVNSVAIKDQKMRKWIIGKNDFDYCKLKGIDNSLATKRRKYFNIVLKTKSDFEWIDEHADKKGNIQYILRRFHPLLENNQIKFVMGYGMDVTPLQMAIKNAEKSGKKYKGLIQNMSDGLLVDDIDSSGTILYCNKKFTEIFGFEEDQLANLKIKDYIAPEYRKELQDRHKRRVKGEKVPDVFECKGIRKDGKKIWLEIRVSPIIENNIIKGTQSLVRDITEKKEKDIQLQKINAELVSIEETERARIAGELHDSIIQKLVATKMYLNAANSKKYIKNAEELLKSALIELRAITNNLAPKDLYDYGLIGAIKILIKQLVEPKKINVIFNYPVEFENLSLNSHIEFNLYRIIQESLNNTIKYSKGSEIKICFKYLHEKLIIIFSNNGVKISKNIIQKPSSFIAIRRRINILNGQFQILKNLNKQVVFSYEIPINIDVVAT